MKKKKTAGKPVNKDPSSTRASGKKTDTFPIVGIGASAGGLEALEGFFSHVPSDINMAFVVIQHLDPRHKSIMGEILAKFTALPFIQIEDGVKVEPNTVYLNPPDKYVALIDRRLHLMMSMKSHGYGLPIDYFFSTLAEAEGEKAVCIVLSGTGTDGTHGVKAVKAAGGVVLVQQESEAKYDGMPKSAIDTGLVDFILPVEEMSAELMKYVRHPYISKEQALPLAADEQLQMHLPKIFMILRSVTGHDFSNYKLNTILRRIERRMAVHQIEAVSEYVRYLQQQKEEVKNLFRELLITVTNFFRDAEAFDFLREKIIPSVIEGRPPDMPIRIWVAGCATGEEAYSLAIILMEVMEAAGIHYSAQIFATDIDSDAVDFARAGAYPLSIASDVSPERLKKYFKREDNGYIINKKVRDMVVFAVQNIIKDPPFSRLDMVSCRNLLIYFGPLLQKKILPLFHYTLRPDGILFLGPSESIGEFADLFSVINTKWKIFRRKGVLLAKAVRYGQEPAFGQGEPLIPTGHRSMPVHLDFRRLAEKMLLESYSPPAVLINEKFDILYFHGKTERFLSPPTGEANFNILKMARNDLACRLNICLHQAMKERKSVTAAGLKLSEDGKERIFDLIVKPYAGESAPEGLMMVVFDEKGVTEKAAVRRKKASTIKEDASRVEALELELKVTREYLQSTTEEMQTSNEELKSTNEELQSTNEELQSTNEELETSKEELHSTNEELQTVNAELQSKLEEFYQANDDLNNLLSSTEIATIFVDNDLRIKRFTPPATEIFNLIKGDLNRPLGDITSKLNHDALYDDADSVLRTLIQKRLDVQTVEGKWYTMTIIPYRTTDNMISGLVLTFVDITERHRLKNESDAEREYAEAILATIREPLVILDDKLRVVSANRSFYQYFKTDEGDTTGRYIYSLSNGQWDIPRLRTLLEDIISKNSFFDNYDVIGDFPEIGRRVLRLNARRIEKSGSSSYLILFAIEDMGAPER